MMIQRLAREVELPRKLLHESLKGQSMLAGASILQRLHAQTSQAMLGNLQARENLSACGRKALCYVSQRQVVGPHIYLVIGLHTGSCKIRTTETDNSFGACIRASNSPDQPQNSEFLGLGCLKQRSKVGTCIPGL